MDFPGRMPQGELQIIAIGLQDAIQMFAEEVST